MSKNYAEDRRIEQEVRASLNVDKDALLDSILTGKPIESKPSYGPQGGANEGTTLFPMDVDYMVSAVAEGGFAAAVQNNPEMLEKLGSNVGPTTTKPEKNVPKISARQFTAIKKFPALIEFLGSEHGDKIASKIASEVTSIIIEVVGKNAQKISKFARTCVADKNNIKQYYAASDNSWVCKVVANGPFRGDEAILYDPEHDVSMVVRLKDKQYENISEYFNIIHERGEVPPGTIINQEETKNE